MNPYEECTMYVALTFILECLAWTLAIATIFGQAAGKVCQKCKRIFNRQNRHPRVRPTTSQDSGFGDV